ncbi:uncharacterized protein MYCFIDRAFT_80869 [Pseudocercospora fijiensis CIRAD86]|uniref:Uncharacterized protein n=1 Tax=Pseudocercospora fijiensis (strain CIRAD86) TaxID=383855 RepID=M2ZH35_PSEFD|nr:uncharacterized protein MYCFIDRAFT_80869 [Pseudocercospora fijiensis CIRAD86]EME78454.1 hypothetical protein MYCFIDRAFT_80869 [Pseudocercospora fijiensis CIRAD86]
MVALLTVVCGAWITTMRVERLGCGRWIAADGVHRIKTLVLLASTVPEWLEAWEFYKHAVFHWNIVRRYHPKGEGIAIDDTITQLWTDIAKLKDALRAEAEEEEGGEEEEEEEGSLGDFDLLNDDQVEEELAAQTAAEKKQAEWDAALDEADRLALGG